ncbi:MAG: hypothetical protein ACTSPH_12265 [Promethearchaeota archaeon]
MFTLIALPQDFTTDIMANVSQLFTDFSPWITLVLGVLLATLVIEIIIKSISRH